MKPHVAIRLTAMALTAVAASCTWTREYEPVARKRLEQAIGDLAPPKASVRWKAEEVPESLWFGTAAQGCDDKKGDGGTWQAEPVLTLGEKHYCSYTWVADNSLKPDVQNLRRLVNDLERDVPAIVPAATQLDAHWSEPLYHLARERLDIPAQRNAGSDRLTVRVAVLDSAQGDPGSDFDPLGHGHAVGRLIDEVACGPTSPTCGVEIKNYPVIKLFSDLDTTMYSASTGTYSSFALLAKGIERATDDFELDQRPNRPSRLVINLSLGWSGCWGDAREYPSGSPSHLTGPELVRAAIARATCRGALVVAAGGNGDAVDGCPRVAISQKPLHMLPGLWGGDALTPDTCKQLGVREPKIDATTRLLVGVGAVDNADRRLYTTDHEANLVAYGLSVVVPYAFPRAQSATPPPHSFTVALSGTSMSAAAVSGAAAALWSLDIRMSPTKVIDTITRSGVDLGARDAALDNFVCNEVGGACPNLSRLSVCRVLASRDPTLSCKTIAAHVSTSPVAPSGPADRAIVQQDADTCSTCGCTWPGNAGDWDVRDLPWRQPQQDGACGTCAKNAFLRRPAGYQRNPAAGRLLGFFQSPPAAPATYEFQTKFDEPAECAVLVLQTPRTELRYRLGNIPRDPASWKLPPEAADAIQGSLLFRRAAGRGHYYYDESVIPIFSNTLPFEQTP